MKDATCGAGSIYPSGAPEITPVFGGVRVAYSLVFYVVSSVLLSACLSFYFLAMAFQFIFYQWVWLSLWYLSSLFYERKLSFNTMLTAVPLFLTFLPIMSVCFIHTSFSIYWNFMRLSYKWEVLLAIKIDLSIIFS